MKFKYLSFFLLFLFIPYNAHGDAVNLTTYYPSPFGAYDRLRLIARQALAEPCQTGTMYIDENAAGEIKFCNTASSWEPLGSSTWTKTTNAGVVQLTPEDAALQGKMTIFGNGGTNQVEIDASGMPAGWMVYDGGSKWLWMGESSTVGAWFQGVSPNPLGDGPRGANLALSGLNTPPTIFLGQIGSGTSASPDYVSTIGLAANSANMYVLLGANPALPRANLGINNNTPTETLDVSGKIRMRVQTAGTDAADIVATKGYVDTNGGANIQRVESAWFAGPNGNAPAVCPAGYTIVSCEATDAGLDPAYFSAWTHIGAGAVGPESAFYCLVDTTNNRANGVMWNWTGANMKVRAVCIK